MEGSYPLHQSTLSVIIPNYNHAHYISEQLQAILEQSFRPIEVIVIDDGSTDNSVEVIKSFAQQDPIVRLFCNQQNKGVVFSLNRGLELASGDYIYCCSADDRVLPCLFMKSMSLLAQYPEAGLCCSHPAFLDDATGVVDKHEDWFHLSDRPCYVSPEELVKVVGPNGLWIAGHTCIVKRSAFTESGKYIPELKWHCDWFAFHAIAFRYGICYIPEALAALRILPSSYSATGTRNPAAQHEVMNHLIRLLKSEQYSDVLHAFRNSALLANMPIVKTLLREH